MFSSRTNTQKALENKKRIVKMLFVVVMEFFICWTPLYVINTITLFDKYLIYEYVGYTAISFFQLLAYSSSCCNPITYCFMNSNFRKAFLDAFRGLRRRQDAVNPVQNRNCYTWSVFCFLFRVLDTVYINFFFPFFLFVNLCLYLNIKRKCFSQPKI